MKIHWRSLIVFGITFWAVLCLNDFFGGMPRYHSCELQQDREALSILDKGIYENIDDVKRFMKETQFGQRVYKFGWTLLLWNTVTFMFCISFCFCAKTLSWVVLKMFIPRRSSQRILQMTAFSPLTQRSNSSLSKIPVKVGQLSGRSSDTSIHIKPRMNQDASCPNLLANKPRRNSSTDSKHQDFPLTANSQVFYDIMETVPIRPQCQTIYKNDRIFPCNDNERRFDKHLENQCAKLREEMAKLQATSLKEHAVLSRKLDAITKEKKDIAKLLTTVQKENRAAKQQLEELMQEKAALVKRLENATKEFKSNTKTKKIALQKLDEATANCENLNKQLEQVSRDKEILEGKLKLLEKEYEKLQERVIMSSKTNLDNYQEHTPERDNTMKNISPHTGHLEVCQDMNLASVSQTEMDMKNIQVKIKQLEKNLENFNTTNPLGYQNGEAESEISLSAQGNATDTARTEEETDVSEFFGGGPRFRYWGGRAGDMVMLKVNE
ncbi:unnamed protein product [Acanthoscelides obtectus]|uniref:Uncharacterized protein n=2 Tax=Acanthoscelides obtectus TaxID=200917 RepID=A0A9P0LR30_ACAOB|nr:unnamed protein product [Acanthoscelides obtectus]CAK1648242.1 hypothetical protein AOBTE_LOCUS15614 [Acanthoscelides obtectus]